MRRAPSILASIATLPILGLTTTLAGCDLYFGSAQDGGPHEPPPDCGTDAGHAPDAPGPDAHLPDAPPPSYTFATCAEGALVRSGALATDVAPADLAQTGAAFGACPGRCRAPVGVYDCQGDASCAGAAAWLCEPDPLCPSDSTCSTTTCASTVGCTGAFVTETCTCANGHESCASPCNDGLCTPLDVLHVLAGHWTGTVTPPSFAEPYPVELEIGADGHLTPYGVGAYTAFYYGQDGGDPNRWINIVAETATGAVGTVGVEFDPQEILPGMINGLHVDATHLHFQFWDSWLSCTRGFEFDLTRAP